MSYGTCSLRMVYSPTGRNSTSTVCMLFTFDFDDESGSVMVLRSLFVLDDVLNASVSASEIESYLAVMRLINIALSVLTEWTQGTSVSTQSVCRHSGPVCRRAPSSITSSSGHRADLEPSRSDDTPAPTKLCSVMLIVSGAGTRTNNEQRPLVTDRRSKWADVEPVTKTADVDALRVSIASHVTWSHVTWARSTTVHTCIHGDTVTTRVTSSISLCVLLRSHISRQGRNFALKLGY